MRDYGKDLDKQLIVKEERKKIAEIEKEQYRLYLEEEKRRIEFD